MFGKARIQPLSPVTPTSKSRVAVSQRAIWDILHEWADKGAVPLIGTFADSLDGRGGLFALTPRGVEVIDRLSGTGMTTDGNQLWRALRTPIDSGMWLTEFVCYDHRGLQRYLRVDELSDAHDIAIDVDGSLVVASTGSNRLARVNLDASVVTLVDADGIGDAWHLNCLTFDSGRLYVTAFGNRLQHRSWSSAARCSEGVLMDVGSGQYLARGLSRPHDPRRYEDGWLVAESGAGALSYLSNDGARQSVSLGGWTRGLAVEGNLALVGISANRHYGGGGHNSAVALVDLDRWREIGRIELDCEEIYSISFVSPALLEGLRRGAGVNGFRLIEALAVQRLAQGLAPYRGAETLPDDDREIGVEVPEAMSFVAGSTAAIECRLHNTTGVAISSLGANPIRLGYMWDPPAEGEGRTSLPWIVQSGESVELKLLVNVPTEAGHYHLKIAAVQEHIAWCSGGFEGDVEVIYDLDRTPSY